MEVIYILLSNKFDQEDLVVFVSEEDAINASINYPESRVEIFSKNQYITGYTPTYNYYKNGILISKN